MSINNQHKPGYKHTPLGWIPKEWEVTHLRSIAEIKGRVGWKGYTKDDLRNSGPLVLGASHIDDCDKIDLTYPVFLSREKFEESPEIMIKQGDLIFVQRGSLGGVALIEEDLGEATINPSMVLIKPKGADAKLLYFQLSSQLVQKQVMLETSQTGVPMLSQKQIGDFLVPKIHRKEEQIIVAILSTWDEAITKTQQLIAQLQQRNKGLMQQLLKPKDDWSQKKMSEIFDRVVRKNTNGNTNVITISAQRGFVKQNDFFKKLVASETLDNYFLVRKGEFCYNKSYSNGYDWGATKRLNDFEEAVVTTLYICFRIKDEKEFSGDYFEYFFDANILDRGLAKIAHEGGRAHGLLNVTPGDFFSLKVHVPPYDEQQRIFKVLSAAKNELKLHEQKLAALQQEKKGLMQKLLTGEVRTI